MSEQTKIQWATHTGSPWFGCTEVSPGCSNCYARTLAETRLAPIIRGAYRKAGMKAWEFRPVWGRYAPRVLCKGFWQDARRYNTSAGRPGPLTPALGGHRPPLQALGGHRPPLQALGGHRPPLPALGGHRPPLQASEGERERRPRMFPSMDDWLDDMPAGIMDQDGNWLDPVSVLADVLKLIHDTPNLDWLLLTKRPEEWQRRVYKAWEALVRRPENEQPDVIKASDMVRDWLDGIAPANVWPGVSMEDQPRGEERIPQLLKIPARVRFLSVEPLLGPVDVAYSAFNGADSFGQMEGIHWVIVGGESGHWARPCNVDWIREIVRQCKAAGVPCFVKQLGACLTGDQFDFPRELTRFRAGGTGEPASFGLDDAKGGDMAEWPKDLRVREFPEFNVERRA